MESGIGPLPSAAARPQRFCSDLQPVMPGMVVREKHGMPVRMFPEKTFAHHSGKSPSRGRYGLASQTQHPVSSDTDPLVRATSEKHKCQLAAPDLERSHRELDHYLSA